MGIFDRFRKKRGDAPHGGKSKEEFVRRLKQDHGFLAEIMRLFESDPTPDSIQRGVKSMGYDIELGELLDVLLDALGGLAGSAPSGIPLGFHQGKEENDAARLFGLYDDEDDDDEEDDDDLVPIRDSDAAPSPQDEFDFSETICQISVESTLGETLEGESDSPADKPHSPKNAAEQMYFDMIEQEILRKTVVAIAKVCEWNAEEVAREIKDIGYYVDAHDLNELFIRFGTDFDRDDLRAYFGVK